MRSLRDAFRTSARFAALFWNSSCWIALLCGFVLNAVPISFAEAEETLTFERHVRPILKAHCFQCHGEENERKGNLDLRLKRLMESGGDSGPAIVPGKPEASPLLQRIIAGEMPPGKKPVPPSQIETLTAWIRQGAVTAAVEPDNPAQVSEITAEDRAYWCFQPLKRPVIPEVRAKDLIANPIDAFVLSRLEAAGLSFAPEVDRRSLIRRLYFDLIGLPPTPEQVDAFVSDSSPAAYEKLVEELLSSQHYGERWGRHWLDVAGYADSEGYTNEDPVRPDIFRYRDYVIRSLNADKPFDRFIIEQLAGDELVMPPYGASMTDEQKDCLIATGFLRMAPDGTANGSVDQKVARNDVIAETIKIVSSSFLGLTVGCAQCHSHRYDPIPQTDYYRLRALFEPAYNWKDWKNPHERRLLMTPPEVQVEIKRVDELMAAEMKEYLAYLDGEADRVRALEFAKIPEARREAAKAALEVEEAKRSDEQKLIAKEFYNYFNVNRNTVGLYDPAVAVEGQKRTDARIKMLATKPAEHMYVVLTEPTGKPLPETFVFNRGDPDAPKQGVGPSDLTIVEEQVPSRIEAKDPNLPTSGRRLAFARHLTSGQHPLLGRVLVNRFWMHHFGKGIVATPGDFGRLGSPPTHPELLDWLASEFASSGWSLKHFHRLVLLSRVYRQSTTRSVAADNIDPDNKLLSHMSLKRLEAESIRDAMLAVSGKMNYSLYGPAIPVAENENGEYVVGIEGMDGNGMNLPKPVPDEGEFRRSIYVQVRRSKLLSVLDTFDLPAMEPNCDLRSCSTVTPQSLLLMNGEVVRKIAKIGAERIIADAGADSTARVERAWRLTLGRQPSSSEREQALTFLANNIASLTANPIEGAPPTEVAALASLVQILFGSNEFLYVE